MICGSRHFFLWLALCVYTWLCIVYAKFAGSPAGKVFYCFFCVHLCMYTFSASYRSGSVPICAANVNRSCQAERSTALAASKRRRSRSVERGLGLRLTVHFCNHYVRRTAWIVQGRIACSIPPLTASLAAVSRPSMILSDRNFEENFQAKRQSCYTTIKVIRLSATKPTHEIKKQCLYQRTTLDQKWFLPAKIDSLPTRSATGEIIRLNVVHEREFKPASEVRTVRFDPQTTFHRPRILTHTRS